LEITISLPGREVELGYQRRDNLAGRDFLL
jgi:hypothetical protein